MEDFGPVCGFFIFVLILGGVGFGISAFAASRAKELNETFGILARQYRGKLHEAGWFGRPSVTFHYRGNWVRVDIHSTGGKNPTIYTQVHMGWPEPGFRMEVYPEGFFHRFGKFLGMSDIEIGSPDFDRDYIITSNDFFILLKTLTPRAQTAINSMRAIGGNGNIYVAVRNYELLVKKLGLLDEVGPLLRLTEYALQLYDAAIAGQEKGIEFIDTPAKPSGEETICQVCGEAITSDIVHCRSCKTPHHQDCWQYYGKCSTFGCGQRSYRRPKKKSSRRRK